MMSSQRLLGRKLSVLQATEQVLLALWLVTAPNFPFGRHWRAVKVTINQSASDNKDAELLTIDDERCYINSIH